MTKKDTIVWSPCRRCNVHTKHDIVCEHHDGGDEEHHCDLEYTIIQCRGCGQSSFRYVFRDYEAAYPTENDEWDVPEAIENYPRSLPRHADIDGMSHVPDIVNSIYEETLTAIKEGASTLAGLGLRGTIEAVCNDRNITGRNLEARISKLASQGLISQKDAERLHAIRFLGNDAAHEIKKPSDRQLEIALRITEHMIVTVYVLDEEAKRTLDTVVSSYDDFVSLLIKRLKLYKNGDEFPLAKFLENDVRRLQGALSQMESQLIKEIAAGNFPKLVVGKLDHFSGSPNQLQHFIYQ